MNNGVMSVLLMARTNDDALTKTAKNEHKRRVAIALMRVSV